MLGIRSFALAGKPSHFIRVKSDSTFASTTVQTLWATAHNPAMQKLRISKQQGPCYAAVHLLQKRSCSVVYSLRSQPEMQQRKRQPRLLTLLYHQTKRAESTESSHFCTEWKRSSGLHCSPLPSGLRPELQLPVQCLPVLHTYCTPVNLDVLESVFLAEVSSYQA